MTPKTKLFSTAGLVLAAALAAAPAAFAASDSDYSDRGYGHGRHRVLPRVTAVGAAPNQWQARMQAVHAWRDKVAERFGYQYSRWWTARDKDVSCVKVADDDPSWDTYGRRNGRQFAPPRHYDPVTRCTVSAVPARGWGNFGWYNY
jgi:hypothetical protein